MHAAESSWSVKTTLNKLAFPLLIKVVEQRMREYESKTMPLLARYKAMNVVIDFEVKRGKKDYPRLWDLVKVKL